MEWLTTALTIIGMSAAFLAAVVVALVVVVWPIERRPAPRLGRRGRRR